LPGKGGLNPVEGRIFGRRALHLPEGRMFGEEGINPIEGREKGALDSPKGVFLERETINSPKLRIFGIGGPQLAQRTYFRKGSPQLLHFFFDVLFFQ
jgi:hypothetical protein